MYFGLQKQNQNESEFSEITKQFQALDFIHLTDEILHYDLDIFTK